MESKVNRERFVRLLFVAPSIVAVNWNVPSTYLERTRNVYSHQKTFLVYLQSVFRAFQLSSCMQGISNQIVLAYMLGLIIIKKAPESIFRGLTIT